MISRRWGQGRGRAAAKRRMARRKLDAKMAEYGGRLVVHIPSGTLGVARDRVRVEPDILRLAS